MHAKAHTASAQGQSNNEDKTSVPRDSKRGIGDRLSSRHHPQSMVWSGRRMGRVDQKDSAQVGEIVLCVRRRGISSEGNGRIMCMDYKGITTVVGKIKISGRRKYDRVGIQRRSDRASRQLKLE